MPGNPDPYDERDEESGHFRRQFEDEDYLRALADNPVAGTSDVADAVGCARETAYKTLSRLHDEGSVEKHEIGASAAWSLADDEDPPAGTGPDDSGSADSDATATRRGDEDRRRADPDPNPDEMVYQDGLAVIAELDLPGSGTKLDRRRAAIRDCYDFIHERGKGRRAEFHDLLDDVGYASFTSFWNNCVKATDALDLPGVETPTEGQPTYLWVGAEKPYREADRDDTEDEETTE